jgi:phage terminase large subunit GpA-like protein
MLGKCANPPCSASFRRLGDGSLFRLEPDLRLRLSTPKTEYFWLCPTCSEVMTLRIDASGTLVTAPWPVSVHDEHAVVVPMSVGQSGLLLKVDSHLRKHKGRGIATRRKGG